MTSYTVNESVGDAILTVTAQGEFPSANLQSQLTVPVEASVLLRTKDITAEGEIGCRCIQYYRKLLHGSLCN